MYNFVFKIYNIFLKIVMYNSYISIIHLSKHKRDEINLQFEQNHSMNNFVFKNIYLWLAYMTVIQAFYLKKKR